MRGYASQGYAASLAEFGALRFLPASGSWIQERAIPHSEYYDARALYPLFACNSWTHLPKDLDELTDSGLVSLVVVTDPFGDYTEDLLRQCFPDLMRPFKQHYIIDYDKPVLNKISKHHRYYARKSLEMVQVEHFSEPLRLLDEWVALYDILVQRHEITGVQAFSRSAFEKQLALPNMTLFHAVYEGQTIGIHLWIQDQDAVYSHLTAFSETGYKLNASYALYWYAIEHFANQVALLDLGSGAGLTDDANDSLSWFKRGWSNSEKYVYLCGRIFNHGQYASLTSESSTRTTDYFPLYRAGSR
jgi:Acetyltransferase (GNAT) domain